LDWAGLFSMRFDEAYEIDSAIYFALVFRLEELQARVYIFLVAYSLEIALLLLNCLNGRDEFVFSRL
jgi:hypothetical protein